MRCARSPVRTGLLAATFGLLGFGLAAAAWAQTMRDPTRPPPQFLDAAPAAQAAAPPSGLQSIKRTGKRRIALLDGVWVKPGDSTGEAVVERIDEQSVVLKYGDGHRETFRLYPEVEMHASKVARRATGK
jgi:MSHA biogenesis protein MshK